MSDYLLFASAFFIAAVAPGADTFLILTKAISNRRQAVLAGAGITLGKVLMVSIAFLGLSSLIQNYPLAMLGLKVFGASFLAWKAFRLWTSNLELSANVSAKGEFLSAFAIGFSNPQPFAFYLSIIPLVVATTSLLILLVIVIVGFSVVTLIYISLASLISKWLEKKTNLQLVNRILAVIFLLLAVVIVVR